MPDLERILHGTPGTLSQTWYEDGVAVDPGTVTIGITRADGTVLVASGTGTTGAGTAARTYSLTTTHTALLDRFTVTWTSTGKGTLVSYLEVVGGFLFSIADARALSPLDNTSNFTTADIVSTRIGVEQAIEQACNCAFVPRYALETLDGTGTYRMLLSHPLVSKVRTVTVAGTALDPTTVAGMTLSFGGTVTSTIPWTSGYSNVQVGYEHGLQDTPLEIKRAALKLAKQWLVGRRNPIDDRAITFSSTDGGTYSLAVPGRNGSYFGDPDVDAAIDRYSLAVGVA